MQLKDKVAVVYGAGGAVGSAVARAFAREGARVFMTARHKEPALTVHKEILAAGGVAEAAHVDALDEQNIEKHLAGVVEKTGRVDVSFNATGIAQPGIQGVPLVALPVERFLEPITSYTRSHFLTARAAARHMVAKGAGVILAHTPEPARLGLPLVGGMGPAWAALEAMMRFFSAELAASGVRAVALRTSGLPETPTIDVVFDLHAKALGVTRAQFLTMVESRAHRQRSTRLAELTAAAVWLASDAGAGVTGTTVNLTGGLSPD